MSSQSVLFLFSEGINTFAFEEAIIFRKEFRLGLRFEPIGVIETGTFLNPNLYEWQTVCIRFLDFVNSQNTSQKTDKIQLTGSTIYRYDANLRT